jgi:propanol-preferring alcohol dehydrogenase
MSSPAEAERMLDVVAENKIIEKLPELIELAHGGKMAGEGMIIVDQEQIKAEHKPDIELA